MAVTVPPHLVRQVGLLIGRLHPLGVHHPGTREGSSGWCLGCVPQVGVFIGSFASICFIFLFVFVFYFIFLV